jgi:predicted RNA-binding protein with TRAM domain
MEKNMINKNDLLTLEVIDYDMEGFGICKTDGFVVFVPNVLKGEVINCLIVKVLTQVTDPISTLVPGYPVDQNILHGQPNYITHWVHQDTTTNANGEF